MSTLGINRWMTRPLNLGQVISYGALIAIVVAAPFEKLAPAIELPWQRFSNVELVIFASLGLWGLGTVVSGARPQLKTELTLPFLALVSVMVVSALLAPAHQRNALLFTARFVIGFLVYLLVVNQAINRQRILGIFLAAGLAGTLVAGLGVLEYLEIPSVVEWLRAFKVGQAVVGSRTRISATLQYPTITSMYLEFVFGLLLGLFLMALRRRRWGATLVLFLAIGLVAQAIILTLSRSGLVAMAAMLAVAAGIWLLRVGLDRGIAALLLVAGLIAGLLGYRLTQDSLLWLRLTTENDKTWYQAQFQVPSDFQLPANGETHLEITIKNTGRVTWQPDGPNPFRVSYHWAHPQTGEVLIFEGRRTDLPHKVAPGESVTLQAQVQAPPQPGQYRLVWDIVQEGRLWFSTKAPLDAFSNGEVVGETIPATESSSTLTAEAFPPSAVQPTVVLNRRTLWRLATRMLAERPLWGVGPDNFRLLYGPYAGLEQWDQGLHTNNMYVEFFVDTGLIGGLLFLWLLWRGLCSLWAGWQIHFRRPTSDMAQLPLFVGISAAVTAFLLHGLIDYFFEFTPTYLMIWITWGLVTAFRQLSRLTIGV